MFWHFSHSGFGFFGLVALDFFRQIPLPKTNDLSPFFFTFFADLHFCCLFSGLILSIGNAVEEEI